jgi:inosine-uridine nucleoside N-ribohydrolase
MTKILLDTDIGSDIDDAVALAYLLSHPDCELLGITTVSGQADQRASLASVLCRAAERDIPIYPGEDRPMQGEQRQPIAPHATVLPRWPHESNFPPNQAVDFLANSIREDPGQVTLLTIGPLTNISMLFSTYPDVAEQLAALVMMGGSFDEDPARKDRAEWNILCDPLAAEITYKTPVRLHRSVGLNVTQQVVMSVERVRERFTAPLLRPVLDMAEIWFGESHPFMTFHDPLAAATIFEPDLCTYQQGTVTVEITERPGATTFKQGENDAPHQVAMTVDADRYFEHFFHIVGE